MEKKGSKKKENSRSEAEGTRKAPSKDKSRVANAAKGGNQPRPA